MDRATLADYASILSFVVSLVLLWQLYGLRRAYLFAVRVPELIQQLARQATHLSTHLNSFAAAANEIPVTLGLAQATLKSLERKLPRAHRQSVRGLLEATQSYSVSSGGEGGLRTIYGTMLRVVQELEDLQKDRRWERLP